MARLAEFPRNLWNNFHAMRGPHALCPPHAGFTRFPLPPVPRRVCEIRSDETRNTGETRSDVIIIIF